MRKFIPLTALIILLSVAFIACNQKAEEPKQATAEELSQMNKDFAKALNDKDAVAAANCYMEDATVLPPNEAPVKGRAAIQKYWQGALMPGLLMFPLLPSLPAAMANWAMKKAVLK